METIAERMLSFAIEKHKGQLRKYTGEPYIVHPIAVCNIVSPYWPGDDIVKAVAYGHDLVEDCNVSWEQLKYRFNLEIATGIYMLSDLEEGNRETRKRLSRQRLADAPGWVQDIKVADLIHNTQSIVEHDPRFAKVYIAEKILLLDVLTAANNGLMKKARHQVDEAKRSLGL